ncbi:hypothetical protein [Streptomyces wuyuanensis]|uniref:hypothetical protein n=1 Tax=Streptomyces wuyuanensis TaxID=1196353 RepID=UPI000A975FC1|nr:hypothetical protein [Streptomyces wuyuanensis]
MTEHLDPADLAELALGGDGGLDEAAPWVREHLRACAACRGELGSLRRLVRALRSATPTDLVGPPPPGVWVRLARAADVGRHPAPQTGRPARGERAGGAARLLVVAAAAAAAGAAAVWCRRRRAVRQGPLRTRA